MMLENPALTYSEVEQTNPNSSSKKHCEVWQVIEFWFVVRFSKFHISILGKVQDNNENCPDILGTNVHPCENLCDPQHPTAHLFVGYIGLHCAPDNETPDDRGGDDRYHWVEAQEYTDICPSNFAPFPVDSKPATPLRCVFVYLHFHSPQTR